MKKNILKTVFIAIMAIMISSLTKAQDYGSWIVPYSNDIVGTQAHQLKFENNNIQDIGLKAFNSVYQFGYSAGGYDQQGNLLFYIVDKEVYEANTNISVGPFHNNSEENICAEVQIIRKPDSETVYYIIFSTQFSLYQIERFYYSEVIVNPGTNSVSMGDTEVDFLYTPPDHVRGGAFAISQLTEGERYIYICTDSQGILRYPVTSDGIDVVNFEQVLDKYNSVIGDIDNFNAYNFEMKVDNNGKTIFAWTTMVYSTNDRDKVFIYNMDDDVVKKIDIDPNSIGEIGGIEFSTYEDDMLYVSYSSNSSAYGIQKVNYVNESVQSFFNDGFSHTSLQHAPDGDIYCVSNDGYSLGRISMTNEYFDINAFVNANGETVASFINQYNYDFYILPENDGTVFDVVFTHTDIDCIGSENGSGDAFANGGVPPYTYEWTQGGNVISVLPTADGLAAGTYTCCVTDSDSPPVIICGNITVVVDNDLLPYTQPEEVVIDINSGSQTWTNRTDIFKEGIRVTAGYILEVKNNSLLQFGPDAKIIVEPTATLTIDNSTLTGHPDCPLMWQGIEVWGNSGEIQTTTYQGKLILKNESVVEHAIRAVLLAGTHSDGSIWYAKTGGIVNASNTSFLNNSRTLSAYSYHNLPFAGGDEYPNQSGFTDCTIKIDNGFNYDGTHWYTVQIYMYDVMGLKFSKCAFSNMRDNKPAAYAFFTQNAGFTVKGVCPPGMANCDDADYIQSTFDNFKTAIWSCRLPDNTYTIFVNHCEFTNNSTGIYLNGMNNSTVLHSKFHGGQPGTATVNQCGTANAGAHGIYLQNCSGFAIEENYFDVFSGELGRYIGIRLIDCPSASDDIYKNEFVGLHNGNLAEGTNRSEWLNDHTGISYLCNENSINDYDFLVASNSMIRGNVGTPTDASGNVLTDPAVSIMQFQNNGTQDIRYYYNNSPNSQDEWLTEYSDYVYSYPVSDENTCPSHYGGGGSTGSTGKGLVLTPEEEQVAEQDFYQNFNDYNSVEALYNSLKDGGNTAATLTEVETAWPNDMWELRSKLLGDSPHLSMDVLKTVADKTDVLPESVMFEILSANPDELRKEELISYLENKDQPLPAYMIDILKQLANGVTYKTILLGEMSEYHHKKVGAALDILRSKLNDSIVDLAEVRNWYDNIGGIEADKQIIGTYVQEKDYASAQNLLDMLPSLYGLEGERLLAYNAYSSIVEMGIALAQQGRNTLNLTGTEINMLADLAENGLGGAKASAQAILTFGYGQEYINCVPSPDSTGLKSSTVNFEGFAKASGFEVNAGPNPASTFVAFDYSLPVNSGATITITDATGKTIDRFNIGGEQGQYVWDCRKAKPGVYVYKVETANFSKQGKLIIK